MTYCNHLLVCTAILAVAPAVPARSEYRVALLIDNRQHSDEAANAAAGVQSLAKRLREKFGFRCQVQKLLDQQGLKRTVEKFADESPVRATTLIYFRGQVLADSNKGKPALRFLEANSKSGRGYELNSLFQTLHDRGGGQRHLVIADSPKQDLKELSLPGDCLFAFVKPQRLTGEDLIADLRVQAEFKSTLPDDAALKGQGASSVSSPDTFVAGTRAGDEWVNRRGMVFCWCPPGSFSMGSPPGTPARFPDEEQKQVQIRDGFWISKYEVTVGQWRGNRHRASLQGHKLLPINMVSQSKDTIARELKPLNKTERENGRLPDDWEYALPSEQQWEYAARGGTSTRFYFGDSLNLLPLHSNFADKSYFDTGDIYSNAAHRQLDDGVPQLAKVGAFKPNPWGLHDIYGNVAEWCDRAEVRGGSWISVAQNCRSAYRDRRSDRDQQNFIGCRFVIRKIPKK